MGSRGVNKVTLIGNLTREVECRYMPNGNAVANFGVATSESWKDQQGNQQEKTEFHNIVIFGKLAEICGEYLKKGAKVYLEGKLVTSSWDDQQSGQKRYKTEINCSEMQMLDSRGQSGQQSPQQQPPQNPPQQRQQGAPQQGGYAPAPQQQGGGYGQQPG